MLRKKFSQLAGLVLSLIVAAALAGCGDEPLESPTGPNGGGGRDTIVIITPPDTTHHPCPTCPPPPCTTCPPDTTPTPPGSTTYTTQSGRVHEAQSHATLATVTITSRTQVVRLRLPIEYEDRQSQYNENANVYARDGSNFNNTWYMTCTVTGTRVIPDAAGYNGTIVREAFITNLPPGTYEFVLQQDLPNHHVKGESDIRFGPGTLVVSPQ